jgi:hypothetical protein
MNGWFLISTCVCYCHIKSLRKILVVRGGIMLSKNVRLNCMLPEENEMSWFHSTHRLSPVTPYGI